MLSPNQRLVVAPRLIHRVIGDEVFVLMFDSQIHWLKNPSAKHLWQALVRAGPDGLSARAAAEELTREFEVEADVALVDAAAFLATLLDKGLVDSKPPEA